MATSDSKGSRGARTPDVSALARALTPEEIQAEIDRIDAGGSAWRDDDEEVTLDIKIPLDKVVPVRMTDAQWRALRVEGQKLGVGPSTLARMWLIERLTKSRAKSA